MAKKEIVSPGSPPSMSPEQAIPLLEEVVGRGDEIKATERGLPEVKEWWQTAASLLEAAFGSDSQNLQAFKKAKNLNFYYLPEAPDSEYQKMHVNAVEDSVAVLRSAVKQLRWKLKDPNQLFLPAGSQHDAYVELRKIVQLTTSAILIVDNYVDHTLWQLLTNLPSTVRIRVLTDKMKGDFRLEAAKFVAQYGNAVEVRQTSTYHDRFIIEDAARCWHVGASIKDAGSKAFAFSEILQPAIENFIRNDVEASWAIAVKVPI
jgi:hypothetical protein